MNGNTPTARRAATELVAGGVAQSNAIRDDIITNGIEPTIRSGEYHSTTLSDDEVAHLCRLIVTGGLDQLEQYAHSPHRSI